MIWGGRSVSVFGISAILVQIPNTDYFKKIISLELNDEFSLKKIKIFFVFNPNFQK